MRSRRDVAIHICYNYSLDHQSLNGSSAYFTASGNSVLSGYVAKFEVSASLLEIIHFST